MKNINLQLIISLIIALSIIELIRPVLIEYSKTLYNQYNSQINR